uniref:Uncharacterized protein n=1 Tax=Acrobeloides nanus TaxID=290746 RepID=A0A914CW09_9BILA
MLTTASHDKRTRYYNYNGRSNRVNQTRRSNTSGFGYDVGNSSIAFSTLYQDDKSDGNFDHRYEIEEGDHGESNCDTGFDASGDCDGGDGGE